MNATGSPSQGPAGDPVSPGSSGIRQALVTGGAGFIGSHVVDRLMADPATRVTVIDDLRSGHMANLAPHAPDPRFRLLEADVLDADLVLRAAEGADWIFHFQANADVRGGPDRRRLDLEQNTLASWNVFEAALRQGVSGVVFASSATVYGEPEIFPTPETAPCIQTSLYGASKLACEAMLQAYAEYSGIRALIFRFVSWTGPRYTHGVVRDFCRKLLRDPRRLPILGDGTQRKSYLDVTDGVAGIFAAVARCAERKAIFNLGHDEWVDVVKVADWVCDELGLRDVTREFGTGPRGWPGDSPFVHLDTTRIKRLGWRPTVGIERSIRATVRHLQQNPQLLA